MTSDDLMQGERSRDDAPPRTMAGQGEPSHFVFLLLPRFALLSFSAALEPLRIANQVSRRPLYRWTVCSEDGQPVTSSCGVSVSPDRALSRFPRSSDIVVCGGTVHPDGDRKETLHVLREHVRFGGRLGGVSTGAITIASAGLLEGRKATLHWQNQPAFRERFPEVEVTSTAYVFDRGIFTCGGGVSTADMVLEMIEAAHGSRFSTLVADMCLYNQRRTVRSPQRTSLSHALETRNPVLLRAVKAMQANIETPLRIRDLARSAGCSRRQIERLFSQHLGKPPYKFYRDLRLDRGLGLLRETDMGVMEVAMACGFLSTTSFSKSFRERFGHSPGRRRYPAGLTGVSPEPGTATVPPSAPGAASCERARG